MTVTAPRHTVWILGDQLSPRVSALDGFAPADCTVLMIESVNRASQLRYHKQKLALVWSAMRHFRDELRALNYEVDYYESQPDYAVALGAHVARHRPRVLRMMRASEYGVTERLAGEAEACGVAVEVTPNTMFVSTGDDFRRFVRPGKRLVMEEFYRHMRVKTGLLMDGDQPVGGRWNYDEENRERPPAGHRFPSVTAFEPDAITRDVSEFVARNFADNIGTLDDFRWATSRAQAEEFRDDFLDNRLDLFGPYEDAALAGERALYHSLMSALLNLGLLDPIDLCRRAESRYREGRARLSSVEGYIRQILGWREFNFQFYHAQMPALADANHFDHDLPLPGFYTDAVTDMFCIRESVTTLRRYATTHHIQRLMILGNFALIAGLAPKAVRDWFWESYADAYDWVVTPNVLSIALYADGGRLATKPYAGSANYINKMTDYCARCRYNPKHTVGATACPFNALYWDFLARNEAEFDRNPRMKMPMLGLRRRSAENMRDVRERAGEIKGVLRRGERI